MKQVTYAGATFVTGTDIADALIVLATTLGRHGGSVAVRVPTVDADNGVRSLDIVFGSTNGLIAVELFPTFDELVDIECVAALGERSRQISDPRVIPPIEQPPTGWADPDLDDWSEDR
jgi:hypothetical protein